jgi:hypothetical protein
MKTFGVLMMLAFALASGCTREDRADVRRETSEAAKATENAARNAGDEARAVWNRDVETRIEKLDREIDEQTANAKAAARRGKIKSEREYRERVAELKTLREDVRRSLNEAKDATQDKWRDFQAGTDRAIEKLDRAWERFQADMRS